MVLNPKVNWVLNLNVDCILSLNVDCDVRLMLIGFLSTWSFRWSRGTKRVKQLLNIIWVVL